MAEKEPQFIVTDRRKFTSEGERREGAEWSPEEPAQRSRRKRRRKLPNLLQPIDQAKPQPDLALCHLSRTLLKQAMRNTGMKRAARRRQRRKLLSNTLHTRSPRVFWTTCCGMPTRAWRLPRKPISNSSSSPSTCQRSFRWAAPPSQESSRVSMSLEPARMWTSLGILADKTKGNLTERESRLLQNALFDLRMMFLELTNAIAAQAVKPPTGKK